MEYQKTHERWEDAQPSINQGRHHITERGVEIFNVSKVFKIVKK